LSYSNKDEWAIYTHILTLPEARKEIFEVGKDPFADRLARAEVWVEVQLVQRQRTSFV
jgi:hypothetical protein